MRVIAHTVATVLPVPVLLPLDTSSGPDFVDGLRRAWDGGDAVLPVDHRLPAALQRSLVAALGGGQPVDVGDALVLPTSGTTGAPRGVVLTHDAVRASAAATSARLEVDPAADCWLSVLPLGHVGGLSVVTRALVTGTPLTFDPDDRRATLTSMVPTQLERADVSRFRRVLVGGSADWGAARRPPNVVHTYGMTETGSGVVYDGVALDGVSVRVDGSDPGLDGGPDGGSAGGQIFLRGPMLLRCYRDGTVPLDAGGWLPTGDAGRLDPHGRLHVDGRMADVIVTGGEKVWPDAVERVLLRCPGVADVAVAGRPDPEWGQRVVAWVVPAADDGPVGLDQLRDAVKAEMPAWCAPKELVLVESLPKTALGKVQRHCLP
jgi:O-succinylbenzoic acid--CoA ligase